jgi:hypothetical protein
MNRYPSVSRPAKHWAEDTRRRGNKNMTNVMFFGKPAEIGGEG